MGSFGVFRRTGAAKFYLDRIDLNVWVLPSIFKRELFCVDMGLRLTLREDAGSGHPICFRIGLPFSVTDKAEKVKDLVPSLVNDRELCALVFGASDISVETKHNEGWRSGTWIEDGETVDAAGRTVPDRMLFVPLEAEKCSEVARSQTGEYSVWELSAGDREAESGASVYLRFRFLTRQPGRVWNWQRSLSSSAHAISDLRVSEFRERPMLDNSPNFSTDVLDAGRVNGFVITSSALKAGRVSPQPKYVRVLENSSWERYLNRHLGRRGERFLITYWSSADVTQGSPFRAFLEVERRRPTAVRAVAMATALLIAAYVVLQPLYWLKASLVGELVGASWRLLWPAVSALGLFGMVRILWGQALKAPDRWDRVRRLFERLDERRFRLPRK